jgi:SET domain-containing protein
MKRTLVRKSSIIGVGLFADEDIRKNEKILSIHGDAKVVRDFSKLPTATKQASDNWIGMSRYRYIDTKNSPLRFINHSCHPNAAIITPRTLVALVKIEKGEEITMDYSLTEAGQDYTLKCLCGAKNCRGLVQPINKLPVRIFKSYLPYITKNFQRTYCAMNNIALSRKP